MRTMLIALSLLVAVVSILAPATADALTSNAIRVKISDGTTLLTPEGGCLTSGTTCSSFTITNVAARGFVLEVASAAGATTSLNLLALTASVGGNCTAPCTRHFPSGKLTAQAGDTFKLQDSASTNRMRVIKTDSSTDKTEVKGFKVTSTTAVTSAKTLKIIFETLPGAFTPIPVGIYSAGAVVKGSYRQGTTIAGACSTESAPCVRQLMQIQNVSLNGQTPGAILATYTASVPCSTNATTATAYCGPGGSYNPQLTFGDQFFATDTGSISISSTNCTLVSGNCPIVHKGTLEVKATAGNQLFTATNSVGQYSAGISVDDPNGLAGVLAAIGAEGGADVWAGYDNCISGYRAIMRPPVTNETRNITNNSSFPVKVAVERAILEPASEFRLVSILTGDSALPPSDRKCNDSGYVIFAPGSPLKFADVAQVIFNYDVITGAAASGDTRLDPPVAPSFLPFVDCGGTEELPTQGGEIRVEIALQKDGVGVGSLVVYLGSDAATSFRKVCKGATDAGFLSGKNLVSDPLAAQARVDPSFLSADLADECCITWADARKPSAFGKLNVTAIIMVVDEGLVTATNLTNHQAIFRSGNVNGSVTTPTTQHPDGFLLTVQQYVQTCNVPPDGRYIAFYRVENGVPLPTPAFIADQTTIDPSSCEVRQTVNVNDLGVITGVDNVYDVHLQLFGGISVPETGRITFR
jgi:hypothetical protein